MQLDIQTGAVLTSGDGRIDPSVSRSQFLQSSHGIIATIGVKNEPWCSFSLHLPGETMWLSLQFNGESLESISICSTDPTFGSNWADWSLDNEMARKAFHDNWLSSQGTRPGETFHWGSIWSDFDSKGGFSSIVMRFSHAT